ncbi:glycosyltransferase [Jeotgalibacillus proteolyticus]|uniref:Glycosyl transferase n=1 Tax=Jeotgalibacillus proteolyticus TaxID=2082395 RepID=A0A2S5G8I9_9BACL|nr:glycosyltransferase [Jeotgalibacillus proteolyticus]PPA69231.1 glycosyl transferase [Jeotgalibacillus proteolyticus]
MKKILISSFDMEVGGVERSLISMLNNFDYSNYQVDLLLYSHTGDFLGLLPEQVNLLPENKVYKTFRMSVKDTIKSGQLTIAIARMRAKYKANKSNSAESGIKQMQYMWKYALPFLPEVEAEYDVAISYLWPHDFTAKKVKAKTKIAWIHTDFSNVETDQAADLEIWKSYQHIIAVSDDCKKAFLSKYPSLSAKTKVIENITSPQFVMLQSEEKTENPMTTDTRFKIVTVARLSHAKGIDNAVEALKKIKDSGYNNIAWYVVGYGGDEKRIKQLIKQYGLEDQFYLLGKKINPYPFIKEADLYVQPSRYEGKAVTVSEAQILSKPVLITNYSTAKSQLETGVNGLICELSVDGITKEIIKIYNTPSIRDGLSSNCKNINFNNSNELIKLYSLIT